jgi:hypothetical protein
MVFGMDENYREWAKVPLKPSISMDSHNTPSLTLYQRSNHI